MRNVLWLGSPLLLLTMQNGHVRRLSLLYAYVYYARTYQEYLVLDSTNARGAVNFVLVFGAGTEQDLADNVTDATHAATTNTEFPVAGTFITMLDTGMHHH
ncbi:hypothetical protein M441DRAFT_447786 [Trichoderma asperellum CBS 433.97]|uniref:Secreted protein n=1 Tax=Trichoderma asperellum (strain ATCC 204424 / CBS 433.97 / NBRC 101777) TaxID=1042311 RepID=A0A2T3YYW3_TRIA4|nr:hypothetical protein M441DRAFT_447786 [Trichoderma asperellum CBS 433.97]PTB37738.1 hypothetical protein M441DRAFT_447786 [Trichoderma asperellum CBS 433.97]